MLFLKSFTIYANYVFDIISICFVVQHVLMFLYKTSNFIILVVSQSLDFEKLIQSRDGRSRCRDPRYRDFSGLGTGLGTSET